MEHPLALSFREIAKTLVDGQGDEDVVYLDHMVLVLLGCLNYDLALAMLQTEISKVLKLFNKV